MSVFQVVSFFYHEPSGPTSTCRRTSENTICLRVRFQRSAFSRNHWTTSRQKHSSTTTRSAERPRLGTCWRTWRGQIPAWSRGRVPARVTCLPERLTSSQTGDHSFLMRFKQQSNALRGYKGNTVNASNFIHHESIWSFSFRRVCLASSNRVLLRHKKKSLQRYNLQTLFCSCLNVLCKSRPKKLRICR